MASTRSKPKLEPTHGYEFAGPIGVFFMTFGLPFACYLFAFVCNDVSGCPAPGVLHPSTLTLSKLKKEVGWPGVEGLLNTKAALAVLGYYTVSFVLWAYLPAEEIKGTQLRSGARLTYRLNAFYSALFIMVVAITGTVTQGAQFPVWTFIYENYVPLLTTNILISFTLATFVYIRSFQVKPHYHQHRELAAGGVTGNLLYDWFIGRELNPPIEIPFIGHVELKSFMELRPGMLGWVLLNLTFMARQYSRYGFITLSMAWVVFSQAVYVFDALWMEPAILTTMDITTDGFGFMLAFGDLTWVPFVYSLQARYLATHPVEIDLWLGLAIAAVQSVGYYIFRAANNEKNRFRTNPNDPKIKHLESMKTASGSQLLVSGWWGRARHINYLGDWIMSWAYCLPTGLAGYVVRRSTPFSSQTTGSAKAFISDDHSLRGGWEVVPGEAKGWGMLITYFFMLYFAILLIHREGRDEEKCRRKYGADWERYCKKVRWRIVPGVY